MELHDAGVSVALVSSRNHPARVLPFLTRHYLYSAARPHASLRSAIRHFAPNLIIPCDERTVRDLHALWHSRNDDALRALIEESVGPARIFSTVTSRAALLSLAGQAGVRVPESASIDSPAALEQWIATHPAPFVLKADGSWAGFGVRILSSAEAARKAYRHMTRPIGLRLALRETILEGDRFALKTWLQRQSPAISIQSHVDGWPANIGVACWKGEVLATISAEAVATESATGPSTVARIIENPEMLEAAKKVVAALGISGLVGFDFMIEAATGHAHMIEMNPRCTPICALRFTAPHDLPEALAARTANRPLQERQPRTERDVIVFFPDTWRHDPNNPYLRNGFHDVPWEQPGLVRVLMRPQLRDRYWIMRLLRRIWLRHAASRSRI